MHVPLLLFLLPLHLLVEGIHSSIVRLGDQWQSLASIYLLGLLLLFSSVG
jgi:hypothetical protein